MLPDVNTVRFIGIDELEKSINHILVDVRSPEAFDARRLPGSINHCVYLVSFQEDFLKVYPDKSISLIVYGEGGHYSADLAAFGRLQSLDYTNVKVLKGGITKWKSAGKPTEGLGVKPKSILWGKFSLDRDRTKVRWVGRNLFNQHDGTVKATSGFLEIGKTGNPVAGVVTVDLVQMTCRDLDDPKLRDGLIAHLQSADFFDVKNHPNASFILDSARPIEGSSYGQPNYTVTGVLAVRGNELKLTIAALVELTDNGYVFQSNFNFDRVSLGASYGSGRLFEWLGMHLVNDLVSIDVQAIFKA